MSRFGPGRGPCKRCMHIFVSKCQQHSHKHADVLNVPALKRPNGQSPAMLLMQIYSIILSSTLRLFSARWLGGFARCLGWYIQKLPAAIVVPDSVKVLQYGLQSMVKSVASTRVAAWTRMIHPWSSQRGWGVGGISTLLDFEWGRGYRRGLGKVTSTNSLKRQCQTWFLWNLRLVP